MIDSIYKNALKEVYDILENTESALLEKIPQKFMNFIKENMNVSYKNNINPEIELAKQPLLKETESILALIYRSYWATDSEKQDFYFKDKNEFINNEKIKQKEYQGKDVYKVFEERKNIDKITLNNNLMVIKEEGFWKRFFKKILNIFKLRK